MRSPHNTLLMLCLLAVLVAGRVCAAPPPAPAAIPDYGGRDSAPLAPSPTTSVQSSPGTTDAGPAAQAGRAAEALVLVLVGIVGVVYALKRFGLVQGGTDGRPVRIMFSGLNRPASASAGPAPSGVSVESSRTLPGGAMLHVVRVPGRTLLLAATGHTVTAVAEWPLEDQGMEAAGADAAAFEDYLARADAPETGLAAANAHLRSLLSRPKDTP